MVVRERRLQRLVSGQLRDSGVGVEPRGRHGPEGQLRLGRHLNQLVVRVKGEAGNDVTKSPYKKVLLLKSPYS